MSQTASRVWTLCSLLTVSYGKIGLDFLVLGDWGGDSDSVPATQDEVNNARLMGQIAEAHDVDFVLLLGDNFYEHGLWPDVHSKRFQSTFEDVFTAPALQSIAFYVLPGNHDYEGNMSAELAYSQLSDRWVFPERYYALHFDVAGTAHALDIVMTDTIQLAGPLLPGYRECMAERALRHCDLQPHRELLSAEYLGLDDGDGWRYENEWDWLRQSVASSNASFLFVAGHYPIYSCLLALCI